MRALTGALGSTITRVRGRELQYTGWRVIFIAYQSVVYVAVSNAVISRTHRVGGGERKEKEKGIGLEVPFWRTDPATLAQGGCSIVCDAACGFLPSSGSGGGGSISVELIETCKIDAFFLPAVSSNL